MGFWNDDCNTVINVYNKKTALNVMLYNYFAFTYGKISIPSYISNYVSDDDIRILFTQNNIDLKKQGKIIDLFKSRSSNQELTLLEDEENLSDDNTSLQEQLKEVFKHNNPCSSLEGLNYCLTLLYDSGKISYSTAQKLLKDITNICALDFVLGAKNRNMLNLNIVAKNEEKEYRLSPLISDVDLFSREIGIIPLDKSNTKNDYKNSLLRLKKAVKIYEFESEFDKALEFYFNNICSNRLVKIINQVSRDASISFTDEEIYNMKKEYTRNRRDIFEYLNYDDNI